MEHLGILKNVFLIVLLPPMMYIQVMKDPCAFQRQIAHREHMEIQFFINVLNSAQYNQEHLLIN